MRVPTLLGGFLLAGSLLCSASDQAAIATLSVGANPQDRVESNFGSAVNKHSQRPRLNLRAFDRSQSDANVCYMMRTYIMVREDRDSDVTRRDGHMTCQPAWKFEVRSAGSAAEDR